MATKEEVESFLNDFRIKYKVFNILFRDDRHKNTHSLLELDIPPMKRRELIEAVVTSDYSEGPLNDKLYGIASLWIFGKTYKNREIYIKISMGQPNTSVICISFHIAEHSMTYPFK